jgi:hypothetical protein
LQSRDNQHVEHTDLLEIRRFVALDETPVAPQHRSQHSCNLRLASEEQINFIAQTSPRSR